MTHPPARFQYANGKLSCGRVNGALPEGMARGWPILTPLRVQRGHTVLPPPCASTPLPAATDCVIQFDPQLFN